MVNRVNVGIDRSYTDDLFGPRAQTDRPDGAPSVTCPCAPGHPWQTILVTPPRGPTGTYSVYMCKWAPYDLGEARQREGSLI